MENCTYGVTKDVCNCCDACYKGPGEECGGYSGKCTNGTSCVVSVPYGTLVNVYYSTKGTCVPGMLLAISCLHVDCVYNFTVN